MPEKWTVPRRAARRLLRELLKKQGRPPRVLITDTLASYPAAKREPMPGVEHRRHKGLNNRAENSHQPTRRRERQMKRFKSAGQAQRFLSAHDQINNLFSRMNRLFDGSVEPPFRIGMACGACHVSYDPLKPPADPNDPECRRTRPTSTRSSRPGPR